MASVNSVPILLLSMKQRSESSALSNPKSKRNTFSMNSKSISLVDTGLVFSRCLGGVFRYMLGCLWRKVRVMLWVAGLVIFPWAPAPMPR